MEQDWLITTLDEVERAGRDALDAVNEALACLLVPRRERSAGVPLAEIFDGLNARGWQSTRRRADKAVKGFESAIMRLRARVIVALVDEEGRAYDVLG